MPWDLDQYLHFEREQALPFGHLVAAIDHLEPTTLVDLGCGTGSLTASLADQHAEFLGEYGALLRDAYPSLDRKTVFPFKRTLVVARNQRF